MNKCDNEHCGIDSCGDGLPCNCRCHDVDEVAELKEQVGELRQLNKYVSEKLDDALGQINFWKCEHKILEDLLDSIDDCTQDLVKLAGISEEYDALTTWGEVVEDLPEIIEKIKNKLNM